MENAQVHKSFFPLAGQFMMQISIVIIAFASLAILGVLTGFIGDAQAAQMTTASGADPLVKTGKYVLDLMTGTAAKTLAAIIVVAAGWAWLANRLSMAWAGTFCGGIILIFGGASLAKTLVDVF